MKLIDFKSMVATFHQPACLVDDAWLAECHEHIGIIQWYFLLEFVAGETAVQRWSLDGDKGLFVTDANPHRASSLAADVALADVIARKCLVLVGIVKHEEFTFNLCVHNSN